MERKETDPDRENQSDRNRQRDTEQEPRSSTAEAKPVASLHQVVGNQAVQRLHEGGVLQANLAVSQPNDPAEREAERVTEQVLNASAERRETADATGEELPGGDGGGSTPPAVNPIVDRAPRIDESPGSGEAGGGQQAGEDVERALESSSGGKPLPPAARSFFEPRFGRDFGDVRVHTDGEAADLNRQLDARAFTHGSDVYFGEGEYRPGSSVGRQLMAHELTHVVQQGGSEPKSAESPSRESSTTSGESGSEAPSLSIDNRSSKKRLDRRKLGTVKGSKVGGSGLFDVDPLEIDVKVYAGSISNWKDRLKQTSWRNTLKLNIFMAKSVDHNVFMESTEKEERKQMERILQNDIKMPTKEEQNRLMAAMLTTGDFKGPWNNATFGYLLPKFVNKNMAGGIRLCTKKYQDTGDDKYTIKPERVQGFLNRVGYSWRAVIDDYKAYAAWKDRRGRGRPRPGHVRKFGGGTWEYPNQIPHQSVISPPSTLSPLQATYKQSIATASAAASKSFKAAVRTVEVAEEKGKGSDWKDDKIAGYLDTYKLQVRLSSKTLDGVAKQADRLKKIKERKMDAAVNAAFAALEPVTFGISSVVGGAVQGTDFINAAQKGAQTMAKLREEGGMSGPAVSQGEVQNAAGSAFLRNVQAIKSELPDDDKFNSEIDKAENRVLGNWKFGEAQPEE